MKFEVDHVGIAVRNLGASVAQYVKAFGFEASGEETIAKQGVVVAMLGDEGTAKLELLQATEESSPLGKYMKRHGPGLHHVALRVENLEGAIQQMQEQGFQIVSEPHTGAGNSRFVFVHPRTTGGVLLELLQKESPI